MARLRNDSLRQAGNILERYFQAQGFYVLLQLGNVKFVRSVFIRLLSQNTLHPPALVSIPQGPDNA
jgi:hypothetical protein